MPGERIVDASLLGAALFEETKSDVARRFLAGDHELLAPSLLTLEIASLAAKKVWRGEADVEIGARAVDEALTLVPETIDIEPLAARAFELAARHRFSAYDASYLALAERRACVVVTLDEKLVRRAADVGLGHLVEEVR
ncbi:type II toxin-antitoxin system VapC family toxin [Brevundimonas sp.]|jgi:predicted nucleic acid-binding protein|uniref:type II toxin-antitoxin system VapC family toxin n=1 Tax=Brevundimonas sp. TaxID=1871086 RepID=UPI002E1318E4|nr:type II toxin-antitoxin system VapC family toxin [Brevundimonas sp.]